MAARKGGRAHATAPSPGRCGKLLSLSLFRSLSLSRTRALSLSLFLSRALSPTLFLFPSLSRIPLLLSLSPICVCVRERVRKEERNRKKEKERESFLLPFSSSPSLLFFSLLAVWIVVTAVDELLSR